MGHMGRARRPSRSAFLLLACVPALVSPTRAFAEPVQASSSEAEATQDYARLRGAISAGASLERSRRLLGGIQSLVLGAGLTGFSIYGRAEATDGLSKTWSTIGIVFGSIMVIGGAIDVVSGRGGRLAAIEERDARDVASPSGAKLQLLEDQLRAVAIADEAGRTRSGIAAIVVGGLAMVGGGLYWALADDETKTVRNTGAIVFGLIGASFIFDGVGQIVWQRTPAEVLSDTWTRAKR
jgi:hypothetical protein